jgi:orotate phosphoribosyltransferase
LKIVFSIDNLTPLEGDNSRKVGYLMSLGKIGASNTRETPQKRTEDSPAGQHCGIVSAFLMEKLGDHRERLKRLLARRSVRRQGTFTLSSGKKSEYYIDCKMTTLDPEGAVLTGYAVFELLRDKRIRAEAIGGMSIGADPIVTAVAAVSYLEGDPLPAFIVRREPKVHGLKRQIEGIELTTGKRVVIVDDVCTKGDSTREAIEAVERARLEVVAVVSLVDREEGGSKRLREKYPYFRVFTAKELLEDEQQRAPGPGETADDTGRPATGNPRRP